MGVGRPPQVIVERSQGREDRVDQAAVKFLEVVVAEAKLRTAGREFLAASRGLNQHHVIQRAATRITRGLDHADILQTTRAAWCDAQRLFGWRDISELDPRGRA